jgi:3-dehydroquinate synthase
MHSISVGVQQPRGTYDIVIGAGALEAIATLVRDTAPAHRYALISDSTVARLYGDRVLASLTDGGLRAERFEFPAGESNKTRASWQALSDALLTRRFGRDSCVIALGGGVTGDLAGFVAATFMRGVPLVQAPTTLLAMVDAAIGGKTGVDTSDGKNLIGSFHQPRLVLSDPTVLATLPEQELRSGLAECVKHGAIADAAYLDWIAQSAAVVLSHTSDALERLVGRSAEIKADFVNLDPFESGARKALNFGHTVGHAIETLAEYTLAHGYAVSIGMVAEARIGETEGVTLPGTAATLAGTLASVGLPTELPTGSRGDLLIERMTLDKKARAERIEITLLHGLGQVARTAAGAWTHPVSADAIRAVLG